MAEKDIYIIITRFLEGNISENENDYLQDWLLHEENNKFFNEVKKTWELSKKAGLTIKSDIDSEWQKFKDTRDNKQSPHKKIVFIPYHAKRIYSVAAAIIILVGFYFLFRYSGNNSESNTIVYSSGDNVLQKNLDDGSRIWLNKHSSLQYAFVNKKERKVILKGEGYFEVSKDSSKPFIVIAGHTTTRVLGTEFIIKALPGKDTVEMTVVEGKVLFTGSKDQNLEFSKGEQGIAIKSTQELFKKENVGTTISWKDSSLIFVNQKVELVIKELEHFFKVTISYPEKIKELNFTAEFNHPELSEVISIFALSFDLKYDIKGNKVYLTEK